MSIVKHRSDRDLERESSDRVHFTQAAEHSLNNSYHNFTAVDKIKHLPTGRRPIAVVEDFKA